MFDFMACEGFHTASRLPGSDFQCSALHLSYLSSVWVGEEKKTENEIHNVPLIFCKNAEVKQTSLIDLSVFFLGTCSYTIWSILSKEKTESFSLSLADNFLSGSHTFFFYLFLSTHLHRRTWFFCLWLSIASLGNWFLYLASNGYSPALGSLGKCIRNHTIIVSFVKGIFRW